MTLEVTLWGGDTVYRGFCWKMHFETWRALRGSPGQWVPSTGTGSAPAQDSGDLRVVIQPADGTEAGLGMLDVFIEDFVQGSGPPYRSKGGTVS